MESDAAALWRAVLAAPHDDAPRLVYADYLEEHGRPERAEFIRLQCALAREIDPETGHRASALWNRHWRDWLAELPLPLRTHGFHRGFVYPRLRNTRPIEFLRLGPELFEAAPLWELELRPGTGRAIGKLVGAAGLRSLDALSVSLTGHPSYLTAVLSRGGLENLSILSVSGSLDGWVAGTDVDPAGLPALRLMQFKVGPLGPVVVDWLAGSRLSGRLETLRIIAGQLGDDGVRKVFAAPRWAGLRELSLPANQLTAAGLDQLVSNPSLSNLRTLDLGRNPLGDEGARVLSMWPGLHTVRNLDLAFTELGPVGAAALAASPFFPNIQSINLNGNPAVREPAALTRLRGKFGDRVRVG